MVERSTILSEFAPQIQFKVTDYVAQFWKRDAGRTAADQMVSAHDAFEAAFSRSEPRSELEKFCRALETSRFLEAHRLAAYIEDHANIGKIKDSIMSHDSFTPGDQLILHCAGVAYAQQSQWAKAKKSSTSWCCEADALIICRQRVYGFRAGITTTFAKRSSAKR